MWRGVRITGVTVKHAAKRREPGIRRNGWQREVAAVVHYYRVRNWDKYQSYPDRRMSWFKFYGVDLCNDDAFYSLSEQERLWLMSCWTIASVNQNRIPDRGRFSDRYNLSDQPIEFTKLIAEGFLEEVQEPTYPSDAQVVHNSSADGSPREEERREEENYVVDKSTTVREIYDHWRTVRTKKDRRYERMSEARRKKIASRLREFSADELTRAIDAVALDPWEERPRHDDITTIFRSQEQVDRFLGFWREPPKPPCPDCGVGGGRHLAGCVGMRAA